MNASNSADSATVIRSPHEFLNPWLFTTEFDAQQEGSEYPQKQYEKGLDMGTGYPEIHINRDGVWSGQNPHLMQQLNSYEKIGYHACTSDLLRGFLASTAMVVVHRPGEPWEHGTIIKPFSTTIETSAPGQFRVTQPAATPDQEFTDDVAFYHAMLHKVKEWSKQQRKKPSWLYQIGDDDFYTKVINLQTGKSQSYSLPPREAVVNAWEQGEDNYSWWDYPSKAAIPLLREDELHVYCGDWQAAKY